MIVNGGWYVDSITFEIYPAVSRKPESTLILDVHPASQVVMIRNPTSGKVLDIKDGSSANNTSVVLNDLKKESPSQRWVISSDGLITNPATGKVLEIVGASSASGAKIVIRDKDGSVYQKWSLQPDGTIKNPSSGKVLDIENSYYNNGVGIILWDAKATPNQKWEIVPASA